jgi:FkbM family methyltransferase
MMKNIQKLFFDFFGLARVCGLRIAFGWLFSVFTNLPEILQSKNLQPADRAMGNGPFLVRLSQYGTVFKIRGAGAISGIREMYVRDTYLHKGLLRIKDGDTVVDLGANMGNFTNLALSCGSNVHVVAVEPSLSMNSAFRRSVGLNHGYSERANLIRAFVGAMSDKMDAVLSQDENYADAPWMSEEQLIHEGGLSRIDFLKCDIEGGEFGLLSKDSKLLAMTQSLAIEIHSFAGSVDGFMQDLEHCGFSILEIQRDPDGTATALAKRF